VKPRLEPLRKEQHHPKKRVRRGLFRCARGPVPTGPRARRKRPRRRGVAAAVTSPRRVRRAQSPRRAESGFGRSSGRARGVFWLQKSTSGAWPIPPDGGRSSLSSLTGVSGERASEAGSRRQSCENGGGLPSRPGTSGLCVYGAIRERPARDDRVEGALVEGRRPGPWRQPSLTRRRAEADLVCDAGWLGEARRRKPSGVSPVTFERRTRQRASEVTSPTRPADENAAARGAPPEGLPIAAPARTERCLVHDFARGYGQGDP
jgi:hypothetical protein